MATALRNTISELAASFAASILNALRGMSLEEILAATSAGSGSVSIRGPGRGPGRPRSAAGASSAAPSAPVARRGRRRRLGRRSATDIKGLIDQIVALLERHPSGLRAEQIRAELGLQANELPRPIADALAAKRVSKEGQKRATTYFAKGGGGAARASSKKAVARKVAAKAASSKKAGRSAKGGKKAAPAAAAAAENASEKA